MVSWHYGALLLLRYLTQRRFIQEITQKLPNNVGVSFINKKAPVRRLFFYSYIIKILQNIPSIKGIIFCISKTNIIQSMNNKSFSSMPYFYCIFVHYNSFIFNKIRRDIK
tara:strand:+ start:3595 stop:3924 length:330 start_codon:yes stop_codon:yes gene_type:complete